MTCKTNKKQTKTKLTKKISVFGVIGVLSVMSVYGIMYSDQPSFIAMAQTSLWQLGDSPDELYTDGFVGIGTDNPAHKLVVADNGPTFSLSTPGTDSHDQATINIMTKDNNANGALDPGEKGWHFAFRGDDYHYDSQPNDMLLAKWDDGWAGIAMIIDFDEKNVGIGTTPQEKLEVDGNIKLSGNVISDSDICIGNCS